MYLTSKFEDVRYHAGLFQEKTLFRPFQTTNNKMGCGFRILHLGNLGDDLAFLHVHKANIFFPLTKVINLQVLHQQSSQQKGIQDAGNSHFNRHIYIYRERETYYSWWFQTTRRTMSQNLNWIGFSHDSNKINQHKIYHEPNIETNMAPSFANSPCHHGQMPWVLLVSCELLRQNEMSWLAIKMYCWAPSSVTSTLSHMAKSKNRSCLNCNSGFWSG